MSLTIKAVMKEASQSMAPLSTTPTMVAAKKKGSEEEEEEGDQKLKEIANEHEGALVPVDQALSTLDFSLEISRARLTSMPAVDQIKKGGNCHRMIGSGLLDVFLRLGFLKVVSLSKRCQHSSVLDISHATSLLFDLITTSKQ